MGELLIDKDKKKEITEDALLLSKNGAHISESNRMLNTLVLGKKKSGKSNNLLTSFAKQDFEKSDCGITFVVSRKDMAYTLYEMARDAGRKAKDIIMLKPSANFNIANELIWQQEYQYENVAEYIDYKEAIRKKKVVIIDMEYSRYRDLAISATAMILMQLQVDMQNVQFTLKRKHFVYIDDAHSYMPFIELLLTTGDEYNVGTMLFMQSREELNFNAADKENYICLLDNNVRNLILTNGLNTSDAEFYRKQLISSKLITGEPSEIYNKLKLNAEYNPNLVEIKEAKNGWVVYSYYSMNTMMCRKSGNIIYETLDSNSLRISGTCQIISVTDEYMNKIQKRAIKTRKKMTNEFLKQIPNLSNLERHGFTDLKPFEENSNGGVNSVIRDVEVKEVSRKVEPEEKKVQLSDLMKSKETKTIKEEITSSKEVEEIVTDNTSLKLPEAKEQEVSAVKEETSNKSKKIAKLPKLSYKPLADTPKQYKKEEMEIIIDKQEDKLIVKEKVEEKDVDIDDFNEMLSNNNEDIVENLMSEEFDSVDFDNLSNEVDTSDLDSMFGDMDDFDKIDSDIPEDDLFNEASDETNIDDMLDEHLTDNTNVDIDLPEMDDIDLSDLDPLELENEDGGIFSDIDKQLSESEELGLFEKEPVHTKTKLSFIDDDESSDEIFELGSYKGNNVDRTGLIYGCRPKRRTIVFPEVTRSINEVYLNKKFNK